MAYTIQYIDLDVDLAPSNGVMWRRLLAAHRGWTSDAKLLEELQAWHASVRVFHLAEANST